MCYIGPYRFTISIGCVLSIYKQQQSSSILDKDDNIHLSSAKNSLKSHKIQNHKPKPCIFIPPLSNTRRHTLKERLNRSTNNGDMVGQGKREAVSESVTPIKL